MCQETGKITVNFIQLRLKPPNIFCWEIVDEHFIKTKIT